MMMKRALFAFPAVTSLLLLAGSAAAEPKHTTITLKDPIVISARAPRPNAAVDVARLKPALSTSDARPVFTERAEAAAQKDPF